MLYRDGWLRKLLGQELARLPLPPTRFHVRDGILLLRRGPHLGGPDLVGDPRPRSQLDVMAMLQRGPLETLRADV